MTTTHSPITDSVAAEKAEAAHAALLRDTLLFRELGQVWRDYCTPDRYGWRAAEIGEGVEARIEVVISWLEHMASLVEAEARDYRAHALGLAG